MLKAVKNYTTKIPLQLSIWNIKLEYALCVYVDIWNIDVVDPLGYNFLCCEGKSRIIRLWTQEKLESLCKRPLKYQPISCMVRTKEWNVHIPFCRKLREGVKDILCTTNYLARRSVVCIDSGHFFITLISYASLVFAQSTARNSH
jgi:hypothetical protein